MRFSMGSIFSETNRSSWAFCFLMLLLLSFSMQISQSLQSNQDQSVSVEINVNGEEGESGEEDGSDEQHLFVQETNTPQGVNLKEKTIPTHRNTELVSSSDIDVPPPRA
jgi:hypothetical protein